MGFLVAAIFIFLAVILLFRQLNDKEKAHISAELKKGQKKSLPPEILEKLEKAKRERLGQLLGTPGHGRVGAADAAKAAENAADAADL